MRRALSTSLSTAPLTALLAALLLTGCTVDTDPGPAPLPGPFVSEDVARIDFRAPLTREQAGLAPGRESRIYERTGDALDVEVQLPGGVLRTEAFGLVLAGPAGVEEPEQITDLTLNVRSGSQADVAATLRAQAGVLGLDPAAVETWAALPEPGNRVFTSPETVDPVASVEARRSSTAPGTWTMNYNLNFFAS